MMHIWTHSLTLYPKQQQKSMFLVVLAEYPLKSLQAFPVSPQTSGETGKQYTLQYILKAFYHKINSYAGCSMFELAQLFYLVPY